MDDAHKKYGRHMEILLEENEFLSDKLLETNLQRTFIWAPTGTGKTTLFAKIAERYKKENKSTLFITTTNAIQDAFTEKLHCDFNQINAQTQNKLQFVKGEIATMNLQHFEFMPKANRRTYIKKIVKHFDNIFVDEFHLIFTKEIYLEIAELFSEKATFCTGTKIAKMNDFLGRNSISPILVMKPGSSYVNVKKCYVSGRTSAIDILNSINIDKPTLVQVKSVKEAIMTSGWLFENKIEHDLCIAQERVPNIKTASDAINDLRNKRVQVIVATKGIMGEALDIKNIEEAICINTTDFLEDGVQLIGRFRDAETVDLYAKWDDNKWAEQYFRENIVKSHAFSIDQIPYTINKVNSVGEFLLRKAYENNDALISQYREIVIELCKALNEDTTNWSRSNYFIDITDISKNDVLKFNEMINNKTIKKINNRKWKIEKEIISTKKIDGIIVCSTAEETEILLRRELIKKFFTIENNTYLSPRWLEYSIEIKKSNSYKYHYTNKWLNIDLTVTGCEMNFKTEIERVMVEIKEQCKSLGLDKAEVKTKFDRCNKVLESIKKRKFNYRQYKEAL